MRYVVLIVLLFISLPALAQNSAAPQAVSQEQKTLVQKIVMEGFVLKNKGQFVKLFKPCRNKYLTAADIDTLLQNLEEIYEQAGYQGLISIEHVIKKKVLTFTVSLVK